MKKRIYVWYVEPLDPLTNKAISGQLQAEDFLKDALCADGKRHPLWRCEIDLVFRLQRSKKQCNFKFNIYCRVGGGKIQKHIFLFRKKKRKAKTAG